MLNALTVSVRETEDREEVLRGLDVMEGVIRFSVEKGAVGIVQKGVRNVWEEITRTNTVKKYLLMEKLLDWVGMFDEWLMEQWAVVVYMFSKFYRNRLVKKEYSSTSKKD